MEVDGELKCCTLFFHTCSLCLSVFHSHIYFTLSSLCFCLPRSFIKLLLWVYDYQQLSGSAKPVMCALRFLEALPLNRIYVHVEKLVLSLKLCWNCARVRVCQSLGTFSLCVFLPYWAFHSLHLDLNPTRLARQRTVKKVMFYNLCTSVVLLHASAPCPDYVRGFFLRLSPRYFPCLSTGVSWWWVPTLGKAPDLRMKELVSSSFFVLRSVVRSSRGLCLWSACGSFVWT